MELSEYMKQCFDRLPESPFAEICTEEQTKDNVLDIPYVDGMYFFPDPHAPILPNEFDDSDLDLRDMKNVLCVAFEDSFNDLEKLIRKPYHTYDWRDKEIAEYILSQVYDAETIIWVTWLFKTFLDRDAVHYLKSLREKIPQDLYNLMRGDRML